MYDALVVAAVLAAGYVLGRVRPLEVARRWTSVRLLRRDRSVLDVVVFVVLHPVWSVRVAVSRRRPRVTPDPYVVPAPPVSPRWAKEEGGAGA